MDGTGRGQKSFVGYEYKEIVAEGSRLSYLTDMKASDGRKTTDWQKALWPGNRSCSRGRYCG